MAVVYSTAAKNARLTAVVNTIDAGSGAGVLQIGTTSMGTVLAEITLADPSGTVTGGVLTFSSFPRSDTSANATGVAAAARIRDSNGADVITGLTVGMTGSGADIILDTTNIDAGEIVTLNSATITAN
ncbi:MAG: hypothetical protein RL442_12 [Pseudomonadota bacterium]|jgi:fermentation-respiration switch protein FrsA (DUF1100 family)